MMATMDRRDFLIASTLLTGAACVPSRASRCPPPGDDSETGGAAPAESGTNVESWADVRALFDLDPDYVHMTGLLLASHPRPVREAIEGHRRGLDRNPVLYYETHGLALHEQARAAAARFLGVSEGEVALTDSTTMGLGLIYSGFMLQPGDEILTTTHDHYSTHESLEFNARRSGAEIRKLPLFEDHQANSASVDALVGRIVAGLSDKTRLLALTWVHSSSGLKLPIRAIADALAEHNAAREPHERVLLSVDGVHGFGVDATTIPELGCDVFVAGCHKWLFGPRGTGSGLGQGTGLGQDRAQHSALRDAGLCVVVSRPELAARARRDHAYARWVSFLRNAVGVAGRVRIARSNRSFAHSSSH